MRDGTSIYECTSGEVVGDVLRGGQADFGLAVAPVVRELTGSLKSLPSERLDGSSVAAETPSADELAARRSKRTAS
jgi:hypothetical protein